RLTPGCSAVAPGCSERGKASEQAEKPVSKPIMSGERITPERDQSAQEPHAYWYGHPGSEPSTPGSDPSCSGLTPYCSARGRTLICGQAPFPQGKLLFLWVARGSSIR